MKKVNGIFLGVCILLFSVNAYSQENNTSIGKTHTLSFKTQYIQVKDALNYGLVYNGPNLGVAYSYKKSTDENMLTYSPEVYFGGLFAKGGGFSWRFKPIDIFYGLNLKSRHITIGAYLSTDYQWQQYPELHGGRLYWFSSIEIGPKIAYELHTNSYLLNICFSNSLAGFTSRPKQTNEPYFYSFSLSEFINVANQNLDFGSFNQFNRTKLEIKLNPDSWKRFSIGYSFEYFGYYQEPSLSYLSHSFNLNWKI
jgi:hypothetical protein